MKQDIEALIFEQFNEQYPWVLDYQKQHAAQIASKGIETKYSIQVGQTFVPAHIPYLSGADVVCRGRTVSGSAFVCATICIGVSNVINGFDEGRIESPRADVVRDDLEDLHQLITDYYECLPDAKWVRTTIENAEFFD